MLFRSVLWEIRRERIIELMGEGFGFYDIRRWRMGKNVDNTSDKYVLPWLEVVKEIKPRQVMIYTIDRETPDHDLCKASIVFYLRFLYLFLRNPVVLRIYPAILPYQLLDYSCSQLLNTIPRIPDPVHQFRYISFD